MYKLIIADDEEIIRNGLAKHLNWGDIGFEIIGLFEDGRDMVGFLEHNQADVILTDVMMYEVSGIEVARCVYERQLPTKVVILSGYREFDYAREAIQYGVYDYILKPVSMQELREVFLKLRGILDNEQKKDTPMLAFSYLSNEEYCVIKECAANLAAAVVAGDSDRVYDSHMQLFGFIRSAPTEFMFFIITGIFERVYIQFERLHIRLDTSLEKNEVLLRLSRSEASELFITTGRTLLSLCDYLTSKKHDTKEDMVRRANKYINEHLSEDFSVEDVARSLFLSGSYFSREYKNVTGENVIDYIIARRMNQAMELMREGERSIGEISLMVGYTDLKYFHRSFRKYTGYTAREYRKLAK